MHPELMRIIVEGMQNGQIANTTSTEFTFIIFGIITLIHGILFCSISKFPYKLVS